MKVEILCSPSDGGNRMSTMQIVDLAGRENEQTSECTGERLRELTFINRSLFQLANCVNALSKPEDEVQYVPFRNSKLTLLLSESFGRNSKTCLLATLTPSSSAYEDNLLTCRFLESTGRITTWPVANKFSSQELKGRLETELEQMRKALGIYDGGDPSEALDAQGAEDFKSREALLRQIIAVHSPTNNKLGQDAQQVLLFEACARAGRCLDSATQTLDALDEANASMDETLGKAESYLSAVESRVHRMRGGDATRQKKETAGSVKLPPLVPVHKVPITFAVEMPPLIEIVL
jgi:hypothetical protein